MHDTWRTILSNWPAVAAISAGGGVIIMWTKKQFIDNVYATKKELHELEDHLDDKIEDHEKKGMERHLAFQKEISANHSELKTLIIHHLDKK